MNPLNPLCRKCLKREVELEVSKSLCWICWYAQEYEKRKRKESTQ